MLSLLVRKVVGYISGAAEGLLNDSQSSEGRADPFGVQYVRDYQAQPGQSAGAITPSGSPHGLTFRALRYDGGSSYANGSVTFALVPLAGGTAVSQTWYVQPGEVLPLSSAAAPTISAVTGGTLYAVG